ncbi:MAG: flagellar biosynthetic protein FliR [Rhodobacteraceae bacterium]|nr:flagellar biosynthetic protein FliR [Paracoccaceae bacterium]
MIDAAAQTVTAASSVFCRITGCMLLLPGFSSARVPMRVRLQIVILLTLALSPLVVPLVLEHAPNIQRPGSMALLIVTELLKGALLGLAARLLLAAVEFSGTAIANLIGLGGLPGAPIEGAEPVPALTSLLVMTATLLIFVSDLHWHVLSAIVSSYKLFPPDGWFEAQPSIAAISKQMSEMALLAAKLTGPFFVYAIVINLAMGIMNKMTPQLPIFFVSMPFIIAGGMLLLVFLVDDLLAVFLMVFGGWIKSI